MQLSDDGQAGLLWFYLFILDYPVTYLLYEPLSNNAIMQNLVDYWYTVGNSQGPNIRALIIIGIFGTIYWYLIGWLIFKVIEKIKANKSFNSDGAHDAPPG